jgi:4-hydroxy-3-methylbut-2-enyl diphosphate reductase IspH
MVRNKTGDRTWAHLLPVHCPYCKASISHAQHHAKEGYRVFTCGARVHKETQKFDRICDKSKQQGLF